MSTEIKPKMVDGEPVCSEECHSTRLVNDDLHECMLCGPALLQQRDEALARLEDESQAIEKVRAMGIGSLDPEGFEYLEEALSRIVSTRKIGLPPAGGKRGEG